MIHLTIDGKQIEVAEGTTVLRAAQQAGIHVPTLCDHPQLTPYGGCRLCLVDVKGARTLQPSCTMPATEGMEVTTNNDEIKDARKFVLSMIFSERNHFCPYCQTSGGDCELQNSAYEQDMTHWMIQPNYKTYEVDASNPYFTYEANRCILCRRCIRTCEEIVGNFTLGVEERGASSVLIADQGVPLGESTCISCGMCVQNCPTGAMMDNRAAYLGLKSETETIKSICTGCSVGCGIEILVRNNNIVAINADYDAAVKTKAICKLGRWQKLEQVENSEKLESPMMRKDGVLVETSWEEALKFAANAITTTKDNLLAMASTELTAEALYAFKKLFADEMACNVSSLERNTFSAAAETLRKEGKPVTEGNLTALDTADCVITVGEDLINQHEVLSFMVKRNIPNGTTFVNIDSTDEVYGNLANSTLKIEAGAEKEAIKGIIAATLKLGLRTCECDGCSNPDELLQKAAQAAGVSSEVFLDAAFAISNAKTPVIVYGADIAGDETADALATMACLAGMIDATLVNVKGKANSVAAIQLGLDNKLAVSDTPKTAVLAMADDLFAPEEIKEMWDAETKILLTSSLNDYCDAADVVLPVCNWMQEEGHFVNMSGTIQQRTKVLNAAEGIKTTNEVIHELATLLNISIDNDWKNALLARPASVELS